MRPHRDPLGLKMNKKEKKELLKKVTSVIINVLLVFLIILGLLITFSLLPIKNNFQILSVHSGSMSPTISVGSLIVIKPSSSYKVGDIITFKTPNSNKVKDYTTHRLVEIKQNNGNSVFITKGDANKSEDQRSIEPNQVIGREIFKIPWLGYVIGYTKTLPGLILLIVVPATIIVLEESKKIIKEIKKIKNKKKQVLKTEETG